MSPRIPFRYGFPLSGLGLTLLLLLVLLAAAAAAAVAQAPAEPASPPPPAASAAVESAVPAPGQDAAAEEPSPTEEKPTPTEEKEQETTAQAGETDAGRPRVSGDWFWTLGQREDQPSQLVRATIIALALLIAFLTVVELWQVPPPSTSLVKPSRPAKGEETVTVPADAVVSTANPSAARAASFLFESNFSRIVLSGLGGLAAVSFIDNGSEGANGFSKESYYFVLFVFFFVTGLVLSALVRGAGEAVRSRIVLSRPVVTWPSLRGNRGRLDRTGRFLRYQYRRFWYWLISFRATFVVFVDTVFNILTGRNQLQTALFSETITDLHEALLEAAERTREEVHRAVIRALIRQNALGRDLPHEEQIRVAVSLLSADGKEVYYIAWERGSRPSRFDKGSVAWVAAFASVARWCKGDLHGAPDRLNLFYRKSEADIFNNESGSIPGKPKRLSLKSYYQPRGDEDYEGFVVLPMPWSNRGQSNVHRRGCLHISFKKAEYMDKLWEHLEHYPDGKSLTPTPNYDAWRGLLQLPEDGQESRSLVAEDLLRHTTEKAPLPGKGDRVASRTIQTDVLAARSETLVVEPKPLAKNAEEAEAAPRVAILDGELCSVLHQALEVLGHALSHFDDEVYDIYVRSRRPSAEIPR